MHDACGVERHGARHVAALTGRNKPEVPIDELHDLVPCIRVPVGAFAQRRRDVPETLRFFGVQAHRTSVPRLGLAAAVASRHCVDLAISRYTSAPFFPRSLFSERVPLKSEDYDQQVTHSQNAVQAWGHA